MKGHLVCVCVVCGLEKGANDPNYGWWTVAERGGATRDYCQGCASFVLVRSDEAESSPRELWEFLLIRRGDLHAMLSALRTAGLDNPRLSPRETLGWRVATKIAKAIGFERLQPALPCREFGRPTWRLGKGA